MAGWRVCYRERMAIRGYGVSRFRDFRTGPAAVRWMRANMARFEFLWLSDRSSAVCR